MFAPFKLSLVPPGIILLANAFASVLVPSATTYGVLYLLPLAANIQITNVILWSATIGTVPLLSFVSGRWTAYKQRRERAELGASSIPSWKGTWPGNFDLLLQMNKASKTDYLAQSFVRYFEELGNTWHMDIFGDGGVFTLEPEHIKQVLATQFENYEKGSKFKHAMHDVLGTGVFNSDGDMWKFHRSMTRPFFSRDRISHFNLFERHADELIGLMVQRFRDGHAIDVQDAFSRFTLDSASEFLFGSCVHSLKFGLPYPANANIYSASSTGAFDSAEEFAKAFSGVQESLSQRALLGPYWPLWEIFGNKTTAQMKVVSAFIDPILSSALEKKRSSSSKVSDADKPDGINEEETLLDHLVNFTDDKTILKDEILNIMIAGRDTTAATLTFATYLLAMYPESAVRLRNEILEKVGPARCPTYEDIREMKYLRAFVNETLRLFPAVPFDGRTNKKATTLAPAYPGAKPFYVPAGAGVNYSVFLMHRRTDLWGPDAMEFDPDRFLDERLHKYLIPNPYILVPFNAGPRICLGQQFAYNETSFMLVRLLQTFDRFELDASAQPPETIPPASWKDVPGRQSIERCWPKAHLTLYANGGMWMKMREASNA